MNFIGNGFQELRLLSTGSHKMCCSGTSVEHKYLSLCLPSFSNHLPSHVSGSYLSQLLECSICSLLTLILLGIFALVCYSNANSMLGNIIDSSSFGMVAFVGHFFLYSAHALDVYNITFLVVSQVCGQRNNSTFSKSPREQIPGASRVSRYVGHFGRVLENGDSIPKEALSTLLFYFFILIYFLFVA